MNIVKAIEILTQYKTEGGTLCPSTLDDALQLGIESLKRTQKSRQVGSLITSPLLPGETT